MWTDDGRIPRILPVEEFELPAANARWVTNSPTLEKYNTILPIFTWKMLANGLQSVKRKHATMK